MKKKITISGLSAVLAAAVLLTGCGPRSRHKAAPEKKAAYAVKIITSKLDLTDTQEAKLKEMKDELLAALKSEKTNMEKSRNKSIALLKKEKITRAEVEKIFSDREKQFSRIKPLLIEKITEFHALLTPNQREELVKLAEKHKKRWHE